MRAQFRFRIRVALGVLFLGALLIITRLYFIQIVHGEEYAHKADRQFSAGGGGLFDRGSIYFSRKDGTLISAATLNSGFEVAVNPQLMMDADALYKEMRAVVPTLEADVLAAAEKRKSSVYVEVAHRLSGEAGKALSALRLPGVQVFKERWRYYPGDALASQAVGIVAYGSGDTLKGQTGLEAVYEDALSRSDSTLYKNFFAELFSDVGDLLVDARDAREGDLITTIEPEVQTRLMEDLAKVQAAYGSQESGGIVMDPRTGEVIALLTLPTFNPNDLSTVSVSLLGNPLVEDVHEFGSIMKPLTMSAGLDAGVITATSTYYDTGCMEVDTARVCNWDQKARGTVSMRRIIVESLNLGASHVATRLGPERFRAYFMQLFGEKTGIDQPGEVGALTRNLASPRQIEFDNMSFGQGIAVTPIQMIRALGALANAGVMVEPHLVSSIRLDSGVTRKLDWDTKKRAFSEEAVRETTTMMVEVVDTKLMDGKAKIPTMSVAAKTGTAQLTKPGGGYYADRYFHSFVGYFPAYAPRFIILLYTLDPRGVTYASETLNATFLDLTHFLIEYYAIPPDRGL